MASRVNTRFVILLTVGVIALLGMVVLAWSVVIKSADDLAAKGDEFMQQGNYKQAEFVYSKAVNKDSSNVEYINKWIDALSNMVPSTETEYRTMFFTDYLGAIRQAATVQRDSIEAHERSLGISRKILDREYSRGRADQLIEDTTNVLGYFDRGVGSQDGDGVREWERLRRYRGFAITEIARRDGVLQEGQIELGIEDLERAIAADPDDINSRIKLLQLKTLKVRRETPRDVMQPQIDVLQESLASIEQYLQTHPESIKLHIQRLLLQIDIEQRMISSDLDQQERMEQLSQILVGYRDELNEFVTSLSDAEKARLDLQAIELFTNLERLIDPEALYAKSRRLLDLMIETDPDNAELLYYAGSLSKEAGDLDEGFSWFERVGDLEPKPLSYEGFRQFNLQRRAVLKQSETRVEQAIAAASEENETELEAMLAQAKAMRDQFASRVQEDNSALMLLDGKIAIAEGRSDIALNHFKRYNELSQRADPEGLWFEAVAAFQLGQYGVARDALELMIPLDNTSRKMRAMLTLAQIEQELQDYQSAAGYYREVLALYPNLQAALDGLDRVNKFINPELNEDPAIAALYTARQMRLGTADNPGDYAGSVQYLREAVDRLEYDPRVARELASLLLDSGDIEGARTLIERTAQLHPEDELIQSMRSAMSAGNSDEILIQIIRESDRPQLDKLLTIAGIASSRNMNEVLSETVEELRSIAPDDKRVIELVFIDAMRQGDIETARAIAQRDGLSQIESLTFRARLALAEERPQDALEMLQRATSSGVSDASVYQMLAVLQRETGRINEAVNSFEQALEINPDNSEAIREYLLTLVQARDFDKALSTARRLQRYGSDDRVFMNLWLSLESQFGGSEGQSFATRQRERMLELNPTNLDNVYQLARLYIQARDWDSSRVLIDQLRSANDRIEYVELDAIWHAEQGTVNGRNGMAMASEIFSRFIDSMPEPVGPEPYVTSAQFMLSRGRPDLALVAAQDAVQVQSPETMTGTVLLGDVQASVGNYSEAAQAFREVVDAGADNEGYAVHSRLIQMLIQLERYAEAQDVYNALPDSERNEIGNLLAGAEIASGLGDAARANEILNSAVSRFPQEPRVYIERARQMVGDESLLNDMLSDLERALDIDPSSWQAYRVRASGYFAVDRREAALDDLKSAIRLNPSLDRTIISLLNELLSQNGRAGEAATLARDIISRRPDDAGLMSRIGGIFASRKLWDYASEFYGMAWDKRKGVGDGATYIDSLVRMNPPNAEKANEVINTLAAVVGDTINNNSGLLAAQALVLQARGRDDFAQQQITRAYDISINSDAELLNWSTNLDRFFEDRPMSEHIAYLDTLKRRNTNPELGLWLDYFIAKRMMRENPIPQRALSIVATLKQPGTPDPLALRAYRMHGTSYFTSGEYERAAEIWAEGLERFPDDWEMNNNLAYVLSSQLGRAEEALTYGEKAISQNITFSEPYETMAGIYIALGKYDEAEQMIDRGSRYINSVPARVAMQITTGRLAMKRGDIQEARAKITDARSVLRASPDNFPELEQNIGEFEQELDSAEN